jgi:DNA invertase Pin-like site-specific DNA recombinase
MVNARAGLGGRQPLTSPHTFTSATTGLIEELGQPRHLSAGGSHLLVWTDQPDGDGIVFARLSGREVQHGETAMGQIHPARELCDRLGLAARLLVVSVNNTGARDFEERPDFGIATEAIEVGWCRWTMWRDIARLAREPLPQELYLRRMRETGTELYLTRLGRAVIWEQDRLVLRTLGAFSAEERETIKRQTHEALVSRWLAEGRGWPGSERFGFRRNPVTKYLEVDPEQWEFAKRLHFGYSEVESARGDGLRRLGDEMAELGCALSRTKIRDILLDSIYMDGEWSVTHQGVVWPCRRIELPDPIPAAVFERNRQLLDLRRGKNNRTPPGTFCLNAIPVVHERCADVRDGRGLQSRLKGRIQGTRRTRRYKHAPSIPRRCHGYALEQESLERVVLEALWSLGDSPALLSAWELRRGRRSLLEPSTLLRRDERRVLRRRLAELRRQRGRLERHFLDRLAVGDLVDERDFGELVASVREEIGQLERRLEEGVGFTEAEDQDPRAELRTELERALPIEVPGTPAERLRRQALVKALLVEIVVRDHPDHIEVELHPRVRPPQG